MKTITSFFLALTATFFISCGENSDAQIITDVESLKINESNVSMYSTDNNINLSATVYYKDGSNADATAFVSWRSSDTAIANVSNGSVAVGSRNGGDTNITVSYENITSLPTHLNIITLNDYTISMIDADANATGTYQLLATATFEDNKTKVIEKNIVWDVNNSAIVSGVGSLTTVQIVSTGDTNITSTLFNDINMTKTIIYTVN
ncbi:MAG: hypothetical protein AUK54_09250 [Helicobacteraceae bacterium CG2_30_36_10]|nr:MAG: hypothetical protein AUK54_09250 [Helicobacteraceae bacterium CG2_30_36_10]